MSFLQDGDTIVSNAGAGSSSHDPSSVNEAATNDLKSSSGGAQEPEPK